MKNGKIFNHQQQKLLRQQLRINMPMPEKMLWAKIRNKQLGVKFRRQHGVGRYIVDFYCPECSLVIELDGDSHYQEGAQEYDAIRNEFMRSMNLQILRFTNLQVTTDLESVVMKICEQINATSSVALTTCSIALQP